jgi:excisionase family DNA binding protein
MSLHPIDRLLSLPEASPLLGLRTTSIYAALKTGRLQAIKVGAKTLIAESEIARFRASLPTIGRQGDASSSPSQAA